jgi:hypothetical protein
MINRMSETQTIPLSEKIVSLTVYGVTAIAIVSAVTTPGMFPEIPSSLMCAESFIALGSLIATWGVSARNYLRYGRII